jgi:hypothetical protein
MSQVAPPPGPRRGDLPGLSGRPAALTRAMIPHSFESACRSYRTPAMLVNAC